LEALKDARKSRLTVQLPNLPATLMMLLIASSLIALFGIALYPPSRIRWLKYFYVLSAGFIVILIVVNILALQSPKNVSTQVQRPIDLFVSSVTDGGVNLEEGASEEKGGNPGPPPPGQETPDKP
jgi:predicted membrane channel-forming protein YqfA (hemolysin III family)